MEQELNLSFKWIHNILAGYGQALQEGKPME